MYCVIVGDIINSKKIDHEILGEIINSIKDTLNYINTTYMDSILADFGLVRGDAFEGVILTYYQIPKIINEIIKSFYRIGQTKVRICVVLGELTTISTDRNETNGPAIYMAFDGIEKMKAEKSEHWFQVSITTTSFAQPLLNGILSLISSITENWTDRQREIVWTIEALSGQQNLVSKKFNISTSVVNKQLKAAYYYTYRKAWLNIEEFFINLEENNLMEGKSFLAYYGVAQRKNDRHEYQEAIELLIKSKEIAEKEFDKDNPLMVLIYNGLAENLIKTKDYDNAKMYINLSLEAQKKSPKSRLVYASTLKILGNLYLDKNLIDKAKKNYMDALDIALNTAGRNHFFMCTCYNNLAIILRIEKKYSEAIKYYQIILAVSRDHSQLDPIGLADILYNMAYCYFIMSDKNNAIEYANEALKIYNSILPPKHELNKKTYKLIEEIFTKEEMTINW